MIKLVGWKRIEYVSKKTGKEVKGCEFYYETEIDAETSEGVGVGSFYLSDERIDDLKCDLNVGFNYKIYYNRFGGIEEIVAV